MKDLGSLKESGSGQPYSLNLAMKKQTLRSLRKVSVQTYWFKPTGPLRRKTSFSNLRECQGFKEPVSETAYYLHLTLKTKLFEPSGELKFKDLGSKRPVPKQTYSLNLTLKRRTAKSSNLKEY